MKTDSLFYRLFQSAPALFFELLGQSPPEGDRFDSIEVKQTAFRLDGVFVPPENTPEQPVYFVEVQFQKDEELYGRLFAEIFLFLRYHPDSRNWRAVVLYAKHSYEPEQVEAYQALLNSPFVRRFYLDRLPRDQRSLSLGLLQLVVEPPATATAQAREVLERAERLPTSVPSSVIIELVETIMVYKFPQLSSQEIAQMLGLAESAKQTRVYQEGREEGREEGHQAGEAAFALRLLKRKFGTLDPELETRIQALSISQLEALANSLLEFSELADLMAWLDSR